MHHPEDGSLIDAKLDGQKSSRARHPSSTSAASGLTGNMQTPDFVDHIGGQYRTTIFLPFRPRIFYKVTRRA